MYFNIVLPRLFLISADIQSLFYANWPISISVSGPKFDSVESYFFLFFSLLFFFFFSSLPFFKSWHGVQQCLEETTFFPITPFFFPSFPSLLHFFFPILFLSYSNFFLPVFPCLPSIFLSPIIFPFLFFILLFFFIYFFILVSFFFSLFLPLSAAFLFSHSSIYYSPGCFLLFPSSLFLMFMWFFPSRPSIIFSFPIYFT